MNRLDYNKEILAEFGRMVFFETIKTFCGCRRQSATDNVVHRIAHENMPIQQTTQGALESQGISYPVARAQPYEQKPRDARNAVVLRRILPSDVMKHIMTFLNYSTLNSLGHTNQGLFKEIFVNKVPSPCLDRDTSRFIATLAKQRLYNSEKNLMTFAKLRDIQPQAHFWYLQEVPRGEVGYKINDSYVRHFQAFDAPGCGAVANFTALHTLVIGLFIEHSELTDHVLPQLTHCATTLRILRICLDQITDTGLHILSPLTELEELRLHTPAVTDVGLQNLTQLTKLKTLTIGLSRFSDGVNLNALANLTNLQDLWLEKCNITDFSFLSKLTNLKFLTFILCKNIIIADMIRHLPHTVDSLTLRWCEGVGQADLDELTKLRPQLKLST